MTARIIEEHFSHPANGEGGWYVEVQGTHDEVMGEAGKALATASALAHGWDGDRARGGWPTARNLDEYRRSFSFWGKGTWAYHLDCWCRHRFCQHAQRMGGVGCEAPAPYTKGQETFA